VAAIPGTIPNRFEHKRDAAVRSRRSIAAWPHRPTERRHLSQGLAPASLRDSFFGDQGICRTEVKVIVNDR
jgi:hypothetical protein